VTEISQANQTDGGSASGGNSPQPSQPGTKSQEIQLAVEIGWTMAVLFGTVRDPFIKGKDRPPVDDRLPTEHELPRADRKKLEEERVNALLARLGALLSANPGPTLLPAPEVDLTDPAADPDPAPDPAPDPDPAPAPDPAPDPATATQSGRETLIKANMAILEWLACVGREYGIAYELGRALRDTADLPLRLDETREKAGQREMTARAGAVTPQQRGNLEPAEQAKWEFAARDALVTQLSRSRVSIIQEWLSTVEPDLPGDTATIVSVSVGRWSDLIRAIFDGNSPGRLRRGQSELDVAGELTKSLLPQGDAWINLLVGAESAEGLLTPEGYVAAGEATLGRSARILKRVAAHYWFLLLVLAAALGGVLYFAESGIGGAGRAWTEIAAVASALGVTWKGITSAVARLSGEAEKAIFGREEIDATAWAVTTIPADLKLDSAGVRALRRAGIPPSGPMGGS
jgi:hypothetical protein